MPFPSLFILPFSPQPRKRDNISPLFQAILPPAPHILPRALNCDLLTWRERKVAVVTFDWLTKTWAGVSTVLRGEREKERETYVVILERRGEHALWKLVSKMQWEYQQKNTLNIQYSHLLSSSDCAVPVLTCSHALRNTGSITITNSAWSSSVQSLAVLFLAPGSGVLLWA